MSKRPLSDSRESVGGYTKYIRNGSSASLCGFVRCCASQVEQGGFVMLKGLICNHYERQREEIACRCSHAL